MNKPATALYGQALETLALANEAIVMQSPSRGLLTQAFAEFSQVLEHDPGWFPALFYQAQVQSHLWSTPNELKRILQIYQQLLVLLDQLEDKALQTQWQLKAYSERAEFLQNLNPELLISFATLGAISDLSACIHLSGHYRFYVKRGRLQLMRGCLLSATEDYLLGLKRLGEFKEDESFIGLADQLDKALSLGDLEVVLSELMSFWQHQWVYQFV